MNQEKSRQHKRKRVLSPKLHRLRDNFHQRHRQHVPGAQRQKILQKLSRPLPPHHKVSAQQVSARGHQPQDRRPPHPHRIRIFHPPAISSLCNSGSGLGACCVNPSAFSRLSPRASAHSRLSVIFFLLTSSSPSGLCDSVVNPLFPSITRYAGTKSHRLPARCTLSPPTAPALFPAPLPNSPPPTNHSIAPLPRE